MKIEQLDNKTDSFASLQSGDPFLYNKILYLKTSTDVTDWEETNSVRLFDGRLTKFLDADQIQLINCKIVNDNKDPK